MKILMTNWRITWFSGSDTYLYTLAKELKLRGHEITVFTEHAGLAARRFEDEGIKVLDKLPEIGTWELEKENEFDIIHCHHHSTAQLIDTVLPDVTKIFVCHGVLPQQETPPNGVTIKRFVAVSEETKDRLVNEFGKKDVEIIRQPVDLEKFKPNPSFKFRNDHLRILIISNYYNNQWDAKEVKDAILKLGATLTVVGANGIMTDSVEEYIQEADIVISLGRGIVEAMACGKPVIVGDYNGYDGAILNEREYLDIRKTNFSGRCRKIVPSKLEKTEFILTAYEGMSEGKTVKLDSSDYIIHEIEHLLDEGLENIGDNNRKIAEKYHDVKKIADKFEKLYV